VACIALYHANGRHIAEVDCYVAPYAAWSLVQNGSFDVRDHAELARLVGSMVVELPDGRRLSSKPPGSTLAALPIVAPLALALDRPLERSDMTRLGKWVASAYVSGTVVLMFLLISRLVPAAVAATTLLAALGTCLYSVASQSLWSHGPATFFVCLALYALLERRDDRRAQHAAIAGLALGMAILTRQSTALFALASVVALIGARRWRAGLIVTSAVAVFLGVLLSYNQYYFGSPVSGGYGSSARAWTSPVSAGLPGLVIAPSRGLLIYTPALLLLPLGIARILRRPARLSSDQRTVILGWLLAAAATLLVYASRVGWWGGWTFGPRYLCETLPVLLVCFAYAHEFAANAWGHWGRRVAWGLVVLSVAIHVAGVFGHRSEWNGRHGDGSGMFDLADTQIEDHARRLLRRLRIANAEPGP
jgi:hypothetical protein